MTKIDALFVNPDSSTKAYQGLAEVYSAIEPPTWALLLAESCRSKGYKVGILDCDAEKLTLQQAEARVNESNPKLIVIVVYGQQPNAGTTSMIGALEFAQHYKKAQPQSKIAIVGSHVSALPKEVLAYDCFDIVLLNEGVYAMHDLLASNLTPEELKDIKGIGWKPEGKPFLNTPQRVVPQELMDTDMPGYAWDLLPYKEKPLDLYRAHFWHANFDHEQRTPFAAIYTSLGCQFSCSFCMINIVNRVDNGDHINSSHSKGMRFWSADWVQREIEKLVKMGVKTLRISDEMFFLNRKYYEPILNMIIERGYDLNMWAYSRIDTVRKDKLELFKKAGVNWLALGVEAGNQVVRQEVSKGTFKEVNIRDVCDMVRESGINVINNYIFGFPEDTFETMQQTLDLALELNSEMANMYPCQALPGSPLYHAAIQNGWKLPDNFEGYAFLSYESQPLPTKTLTPAQVLKFRDDAWQAYFTNPKYLDLVEKRFGLKQRQNIEDMSKVPMKRKLVEEAEAAEKIKKASN
jgi:anaerobic magnesium-protoporphyrin IX monomethyl ester cyclase